MFTWAEGGGTKMHVTFQVDWTGKSMLKGTSTLYFAAFVKLNGVTGTINSQSVSGQKHWNSLLAKKIRQYVKAHPDEFPATKGAKEGAGEADEGGDAGAGEEGLEAAPNGQGDDSAAGGASGPRDPMESLQSQQTLLFEHGPLAYLADDPVRAACLVLVLLMLLAWFWSALKRLVWTGQVVSVPVKRLSALEAAEGELKVLVGDVRAHLKRAAGTAGRGVGKAVKGTTASGVVGGTGRVVKRTALPDL